MGCASAFRGSANIPFGEAEGLSVGSPTLEMPSLCVAHLGPKTMQKDKPNVSVGRHVRPTGKVHSDGLCSMGPHELLMLDARTHDPLSMSCKSVFVKPRSKWGSNRISSKLSSVQASSHICPENRHQYESSNLLTSVYPFFRVASQSSRSFFIITQLVLPMFTAMMMALTFCEQPHVYRPLCPDAIAEQRKHGVL